MLEETIQRIPSDSGSYLLWLDLPQPQHLSVGKLGSFTFLSGNYIYLGSACGPGGLRARLGRHLMGKGKLHWHIDHLRKAAQVSGYGYAIHKRGAQNRIHTECNWSQKLAALPYASIPVRQFGSSDCRSVCCAHLVYFQTLDVDRIASLIGCKIFTSNSL